MIKLYPHQSRASGILQKNQGYLLAYGMGLGKTFIALDAAKQSKGHTVVVAPAFLIPTWQSAIKEYDFKNSKVRSIEVISWNRLSRIKLNPMTKNLIMDESHYAKNPEAKRTIAALYAAEEIRNYGGNVWLLTGTPASKSSAELHTQFQLIGLPKLPKFQEFAERFTYKSLVKIAGMYKPKVVYKGVKNVEELRALYSPRMEVLNVKDVIDLPDEIKKRVICKASAFDQNDIDTVTDGNFSASDIHFSRKKKLQADLNVSTAINEAQAMLNAYGKVVIFSDHVDSTREIAAHFDCEYIIGGDTMKKRQRVLANFANGENVLPCSIGAASVGLNLQHCNAMVFNDLPWDAAQLQQAMKRIHRIGQKKKCFYSFVLDEGMGEIIYKKLAEKIAAMEKIK